jgi:carboxyl-terminal processing protease
MQRAITAVVIATLASLASVACLSNVDIMPIVKKSEHTALYREIFNRLATRHYHGQTIDDSLSERYLDQYIDQLDPIKGYFLESDIAEFGRWRTTLDDLAKRGDVTPGFIMFNRLRERATSQLTGIIALLEDPEYRFDLTTDETIVLDADKRDWFVSAEDASLFWEKRLRDSMIRLILNDKEVDKARELLIKRFKNQIKQYEQRDSQDVFQNYVNALAKLYDPHTAYFSPRTTENFQINMSLSLEGIGAQLTTEDEYTKVIRVIPGGPADLQGIIQAEDKIAGVAQGDSEMVDVVGWRIDEVVDLIRGAKGSVVRLQIIPNNGTAADSTKIIAITRDTVKLEEKSAQSEIVEFEQDGRMIKIGVIDIPAFYMDFDAFRKGDKDFKSTTRDVRNLLKKLSNEKVDGIVLDLRNNGGGSLNESTTLTDLFIDYGPVVQIKDSQRYVYRNQRAKIPAVYDGPLLVMINRLSASASEILAGALQDYGRALIVGSQSFGKGTVQELSGLSSGQLKLTVSKFYRVSGDSTQHRGVLPDIAFPSAYDKDEVGESHEENALPWDSIHSVAFKRSTHLGQFIVPLTLKHEARSAKDPDYRHMIQKLEFSEEWTSGEALSLNIANRRARAKDWEMTLLEFENSRRKAKKMEVFSDIEAWKDDQKDEPEIATDQDGKIKAKNDVNKEAVVEEKNFTESDPMLQEAAYILADQIVMLSSPSKSQLAENNTEKRAK